MDIDSTHTEPTQPQPQTLGATSARVLGTVLLTWYFLRYASVAARDSAAAWNIIDWINLVFHEAGHTIFMFFGDFIHVLAGSAFEVFVPAFCVGYFMWKRQFGSASVLGFWLGQSILNVAIYAGDAVVQVLPLLGGDDSQHDWNYLLNETGLINYTDSIAHGMYATGVGVMIVSALACLYLCFGDTGRATIRRHMGLKS